MKPIPIIVLQYGKFDLTEVCIKTLRAQSVKVEIFLVDGASPGRSDAILEKLAKLADRHLFLEENRGYAGGNNAAIKELLKADYDYFMVLNNDTEVAPDCLGKMADFMEKQPQAGQLCARVYYPNGKLQSAGAGIRPGLFEPYLYGNNQDDSPEYDQAKEVAYAPGVAILVRCSAAREVGLIPEEYFLFGEDADWSLQFQKHGWQVWYCPDAKLTHHESASMGSSRIKGYYLTRSNIMLARKYCPDFRRFRRLLFLKLIRQSIKYYRSPGFVRGMWQGFYAKS